MLSEASVNDVSAGPGKNAMVKYGYNPNTMSRKERLKIMFLLSKQGWYKRDKALGRLHKDARSASRDPRYNISASYDPTLEVEYGNNILENPQYKETQMENEIEYTSFSDFIAENEIKDNSMALIYAYVNENFDALVEQASEGNEFAIALIENANAIEEHFIGE